MKSNHFMKIVLQVAIDNGKLEIPKRFLDTHGNNLASKVTLVVGNGDKWAVKLLKQNGLVWFDDGISEFIQFYSIKERHFIIFEFKGSCEIRVRICSRDMEQVDYPSKPPAARADPNKTDDDGDKNYDEDSQDDDTEEEEEDDTEEDDDDTEEDDDDDDDDVWDVPPSRVKSTASRGTKIGKRGVELFKNRAAGGRNPSKKKRKTESSTSHQRHSFEVYLQRPYVTEDYIMIPCKFARMHELEGRSRIILVGEDVREWRVVCRSNGSDRRQRMKLCGGWERFVRAYKLQVGDICLFQLVAANEFTLRVTINP